jgi:hypothetical protein
VNTTEGGGVYSTMDVHHVAETDLHGGGSSPRREVANSMRLETPQMEFGTGLKEEAQKSTKRPFSKMVDKVASWAPHKKTRLAGEW